MDTKPYIYKFVGFQLDPIQGIFSFQNSVIDIPDKSFQLLEKLLQADHEIVGKYTLLDELWTGIVVSEWSLSRLVSDTRQLLADHVPDQDIIQTLRGKGFRIHPKILIEKSNQTIDKAMVTSLAAKKPKRLNPIYLIFTAVTLLTFSTFAVYTNWFRPSSVESEVPKIHEKVSMDYLTMLPVQILTGDDQDKWVEYGVMTLIIDELQRFPEINITSMSSTLSNLANIKFEYEQQTVFEQVCPTLGCKQLLFIKLALTEDNRPNFSYQLIFADGQSKIYSFINEDILQASNMMLEHLLQTLMPQQSERLTLSHTYTNNSIANQDYAIGVSRIYHGEYQNAKNYLDLALKREPTFMWAKIYQIELLFREGKLKQAQQGVEQLMTEALDIRQNIFLQNLLSNIAYSQGDLKKSIDIAINLLQAIEQTEDKELFGNTHMNIGTSYQSYGQIDKALAHLNIALNTFQQGGFKLREAQALLNLGNAIWVGNSDYELSSQYYQKSADIFRQLGAKGYLVYAKHMAAGIKISTNRFDIAKRELNDVIKLYEDLEDTEGALIAGADLVLLALKTKDLVQAQQLGLAVYKKSEGQYTYARSIVSAYLAITYLNLNQLSKSEEYLEEREKYEWFDPRPAYAMLPASFAHAKGEYQLAVDLCEKLKMRLGDQWSSDHQIYADTFLLNLQQGKSSIKDYADLNDNRVND